MTIPPSVLKDGFVPMEKVRNKVKLHNGQYLKPILIGTEGMTDTGKTRFALTIPGNIQMLSIDRNYDGVFDSPGIEGCNPNVAIKVVSPPLQGQAKITDYQEYHKLIRESCYSALADPWSQVVFVDGDSDWFEIHILAHFGKLTQIYPQTRYAAPYAEKRAIVAKMHDSGKIVICTNKVKDSYRTVRNEDGSAKLDDQKQEVREKTGEKERQGFKDQDFLWNFQLRHLYKPAGTRKIGARVVDTPQQWGIQILKCKHDMSLINSELWGDDCTFRGLVDLVYPDVDPRRFGFAE